MLSSAPEQGLLTSTRDGHPHIVVIAPPATYVDRWCEYFRGLGWRVDWITYAFPEERAVGHIPDLGSGSPLTEPWRLVRESWRARRLLARLKPDLVHAHWFTGPAWIMASMPGFPFIATVWGSDVLRFAGTSRFRRMLARRVGRRAAAITYDADLLADALVSLGLSRASMHRIVFGADSELFVPRLPERAFLRDLGVTNDDPVVLFMRGLDAVYEPDTVIRGFGKALRERPCNLLIRSDHPHSSGPFASASARSNWSRLEPLIESLSIEDRVVPYTSVDREDLPRLLSSSSVFLSVSNSDGTSVALLEALFCETPVIVSDLPANREWILDESFGKIVPVGDPEALGAAIAEVLADPEGARAAARRAGVHAREFGDATREFTRARDLSLSVLNMSISARDDRAD